LVRPFVPARFRGFFVESIEAKIPSQPLSPGHHLLQGTVLVFMAEGLLPLTGIIITSFLTRRLHPDDFGLLMLSSTLIYWVEFAITSLFSRATVKIIGETEDWRPAGAMVLRLHVFVSTGTMIACWCLAKPCAALLGEPKLAAYLALFALDLPIFSLSSCHRNILVGRGQFAKRAWMTTGRAIARLFLILLLVGLGFSVNGALAGSIGASLVELAIARYYVRPSWSGRTANPIPLWNYAVPIFLSTLAMRFLGMDLFILKMLGASAAQAGIYGAAQNAAFSMPTLLALSLSPLLLSTITRVQREKDWLAVRSLVLNVIRITIALLPFFIIASEASDEIAVLIFGAHFSDAGPLMALLLFAGLAGMMINMLNSILIACENPSWTLKLTAPLIPIAIALHLIAIPRFGPIGAAAVTTATASLGALAGMIVVHKRMEIRFPIATLLRVLLVSGIAYPLVHLWPAHGFAIVLKLTVASLLALIAFIAMGELRQSEIHFFLSFVRRILAGRRASCLKQE
jgi:O-antigen/teichoic acid export membrane protein